MKIRLNLSANELSALKISQLSRELRSSIIRNVGHNVEFATVEKTVGADQTTTKGVEIEFSTLLLTFLSSGTAVAMLEIFRSFLGREKALVMELQREDGTKLVINSKNLDPKQLQEYLKCVESFHEIVQ